MAWLHGQIGGNLYLLAMLLALAAWYAVATAYLFLRDRIRAWQDRRLARALAPKLAQARVLSGPYRNRRFNKGRHGAPPLARDGSPSQGQVSGPIPERSTTPDPELRLSENWCLEAYRPGTYEP